MSGRSGSAEDEGEGDEPSFFADPKRLAPDARRRRSCWSRRSTSCCPKIVGIKGGDQPSSADADPGWIASRSASTSRCSSRTSRCSAAWSASASLRSSGASPTRSRWRAWRPPACSPPAAPAGSCSPTGRCARPACRGGRRRCRMVAFLVLLYAVYMLALVVFGVLLRTGVLSGEAPVGLTIVPAAIAGERSWSSSC